MPYQRKKTAGSRITISPTVDLETYLAVKSRGFIINDLIDMAFAAVLEIDYDKELQYQSILEAKERLQKVDYKQLIKRAKEKQAAEESAALTAEEKKQTADSLLKLVVKSCKPPVKKGMNLHGTLISLQKALDEDRESDTLTRELKLIRCVLDEHGYLETTSDAEIRSLLKKSIEVWLLNE